MKEIIIFISIMLVFAFFRSTVSYFKAKKEWKRYLSKKETTWYCTVCHTTQSNYEDICLKSHDKENYSYKPLSEILEWMCTRCKNSNKISHSNCDKCGLRQNKNVSFQSL